MSRQWAITPEVIRLVRDCSVPVGLVLGGSVGEGTERPDSDVDFFAVADAPNQPQFPGFTVISDKNGSNVFERNQEGFPVHIACWTTASLNQILQEKPYMTYPLLKGKVVFDPAGIAQTFRERIREYFDAHPTLERAWEQQLMELHQAKNGLAETLAFPKWSDFIAHIEKTIVRDMPA